MRPERIQGNVFVANLPGGLADEQLAELFDAYGMVLRAYLARDPVSGETRGHGLVQLAPDRAVAEAVAGVNGTTFNGRRLDVRRADPEMSLVPAALPREARYERPRPPPRAPIVERITSRPRQPLAMGARRLSLSSLGRDAAP